MKKIVLFLVIALIGSVHAATGFYALENPREEIEIRIPAGMRLYSPNAFASSTPAQYYHKSTNEELIEQRKYNANLEHYTFDFFTQRNDKTIWASVFRKRTPRNGRFKVQINLKKIKSVTLTEKRTLLGQQIIKIKANAFQYFSSNNHQKNTTPSALNQYARTQTSQKRTQYTRLTKSTPRIRTNTTPRLFSANKFRRLAG